MPINATLSISKDVLRLAGGPEILNIDHRIFFVNILNGEVSKEFDGYDMPIEQITKFIPLIISHLNQFNFLIQMDSNVKQIVDDINREQLEFEQAKKIGKLKKENIEKKITVPGLKRELKPYQIPAVSHMVDVRGAANFSVPGSGKTSIVLSAFSILKEIGDVNNLMVIGPRSSFMPWEEEFYSCFERTPKSVRIIGTKDDRKIRYNQANSSDIVLLTYQMASKDADEIISFLRTNKTMLVLDESHNIKKFEGGTWAEAILGFAPYAKRRIILSGTPVPHSIQDLWSQTTFLWPHNPPLGQKDKFKYEIEKDEQTTISRIKDKLYPFYWRIKKKDLDLPKPIFHIIKIPMNKYQKAIYDVIAARVLSELINAPEERSKLRAWKRARMIRLLQAASNPTLLTRYSEEFKIPPLDGSGLSIEQIIERYSDYETPAKIDKVEKLVRELVKNNQKVIIWTAFIHNIKTLQNQLSDLSPDIIFGDIPKDENEDEEFNREKIIHEFKTLPNHMVLIANPSACAESISLHKICFHAIYLDRTFNGAHYMQSLDRLHRIGLEKNDKVNYWIIECENTIDEVINARLNEKQETMLKLLEEDFYALNLDSSEEEFSEENEEDKDFLALIKHLKATIEGVPNDRKDGGTQ